MQEILIVVAVVAAVIAHSEWRHQQLQESIDVLGTMIAELIDMQK
jgi:hypothetical protein